MRDADANRDLFEEQVDIVMKAFHSESFSHRGKHYTLPPRVPYRGYDLEELTLVPRPIHRPVECWQPVVSASARGLDFMMKHRIKGLIGGGAATMAEKSIYAYQEAAHRAGLDYKLGEGLSLGIFYHLADSRERAVREITPWYEEHVKMFGPLGFVPGITPVQLEASTKRGGWDAAGVPTVEHYMKVGAWFAGTPDELTAYLCSLEQRFPGLEYVHLSNSMGTPKAAMLEQLAWLGKEVIPKFAGR
jgi:alkanesulfonate monooxygenase SsuD/methylene tetrahydromethanopterin reductase-like flavin-dependent oxidoreductase (luciferase family)